MAEDLALRTKEDESQAEKKDLQNSQQKPFAGPTQSSHPAKAPSRALKSPTAEKVLLVECEVTLRAAREHVFEKMLAEEQLSGSRRRSAGGGRGTAPGRPAAGKVALAKAAPGTPADASDKGSRSEAAKKGAGKDAVGDALAPSGLAGPVEKRAKAAQTWFFEVEATPRQLGSMPTICVC
jgi:hypothetical protein